jgi:hypothetical protein
VGRGAEGGRSWAKVLMRSILVLPSVIKRGLFEEEHTMTK